MSYYIIQDKSQTVLMSHGLSQLTGVHKETWIKSNIKSKNKLLQILIVRAQNNDLPVYCSRFVKNIDQSTKIFKFIFFALFAHPNVPQKMYLIKLMYIFCDNFTDLMLSDCRERFSLSASILSSNMIVYLLYYHQVGLWQLPCQSVPNSYQIRGPPGILLIHVQKVSAFPQGLASLDPSDVWQADRSDSVQDYGMAIII